LTLRTNLRDPLARKNDHLFCQHLTCDTVEETAGADRGRSSRRRALQRAPFRPDTRLRPGEPPRAGSLRTWRREEDSQTRTPRGLHRATLCAPYIPPSVLRNFTTRSTAVGRSKIRRTAVAASPYAHCARKCPPRASPKRRLPDSSVITRTHHTFLRAPALVGYHGAFRTLLHVVGTIR
jgi:hypothetical protein